MRAIVARAGIGAILAGLVVAAGPGTGGAAPACRPALAPDDERVLASLINSARAKHGVGKVRRHAVLLKAGRRKSMAMAAGARFGHAKGSMSWAAGRAAAQNIAMAPDARSAFTAMLASEGHRRNLLDAEWRFTGVGAARACDGAVYFTINLMAPPPPPS